MTPEQVLALNKKHPQDFKRPGGVLLLLLLPGRKKTCKHFLQRCFFILCQGRKGRFVRLMSHVKVVEQVMPAPHEKAGQTIGRDPITRVRWSVSATVPGLLWPGRWRPFSPTMRSLVLPGLLLTEIGLSSGTTRRSLRAVVVTERAGFFSLFHVFSSI